MVALFSLAFLGGLSLIGPWAAQHAYYFFGSSIVSTGVLVSLMHGKGKFKSTLGTLTQWSLLIGMAYCAREPWWVLSRTPNDWKMGSRAKEYVDGIRKTSTNLQVFTDDQTCPSKLLLSHSPGWMLGTNLKQFELHCSTRGPDALFIVDATTWKSETIENYLCLKRLNSIEISDPKQNLQWLLLRQPH